MGNITVTSNLVGGIDHDNTFIGFIGQDTCYFTQQGGFPHTWATKYQDGLTLLDNISDQGNTAEYCSTNAAGQADDFPFSVAHSTNSVECTLNTSAVIVAEFTDTLDYEIQVVVGNGVGT